jgi:hypothetical protein
MSINVSKCMEPSKYGVCTHFPTIFEGEEIALRRRERSSNPAGGTTLQVTYLMALANLDSFHDHEICGGHASGNTSGSRCARLLAARKGMFDFVGLKGRAWQRSAP